MVWWVQEGMRGIYVELWIIGSVLRRVVWNKMFILGKILFKD